MTACDFCERQEPEHILWWCEGCGAHACTLHLKHVAGIGMCNPDPATWPGRGCYKPPVPEVAE